MRAALNNAVVVYIDVRPRYVYQKAYIEFFCPPTYVAPGNASFGGLKRLQGLCCFGEGVSKSPEHQVQLPVVCKRLRAVG